jgi:hypothetical protein
MKRQIRLKSRPTQNLLSAYQPSYLKFAELADILLNQTLIHASTKTYRICELEFYYCGEGHEDTYTHCSDEQQLNCKFYFHKYGNGTYKSGTYKGLDITLSPDNKAYFGVLIRSIQDQENGDFIEGPCRSVNTFLQQFDCPDVAAFMNDRAPPLDIYDTNNGIYITHDTLEVRPMYKGPRIGLSDKYMNFRDVTYRYATSINSIKKNRKTFVAC